MTEGAGPRGLDGGGAGGEVPALDMPVTAESPRLRFRTFLAARTGGVAEATWLLDQVLPRFSADQEARLVVEELVDHLARLMLFDALHDDEAGVSVWTSAAGGQLVVSAMDTIEAVVGLGRLSRGCDDMRTQGKLRTDRRAGMLAVICGEVRRRLLEHALELRRVSDPVRLVSLDALLALARALEAGTVSHVLAAGVLQPGAFADPLVALLAGDELPAPAPSR